MSKKQNPALETEGPEGKHTAGLEPAPATASGSATASGPGGRRNLRLPIIVGILAVLVAAVGLTVGYTTLVAPKIASATAARCASHYDGTDARAACRAGHDRAAAKAESAYRAAQKKKELEATCKADYSDTTAQIDCVAGDTEMADDDQAAADAAAAAAAKLASQGDSADNPIPAGTHASMQSTNRLDGTTVTYDEWVTGFDTDWRGYDEFSAPSAGKKYVSFVVHVKADDAGVDASDMAYDASFTDSKGNVYAQSDEVYDAKPEMPDVTLGAGQQAKGIVVFEVPTSVNSGLATIGDGSVFLALKK